MLTLYKLSRFRWLPEDPDVPVVREATVKWEEQFCGWQWWKKRLWSEKTSSVANSERSSSAADSERSSSVADSEKSSSVADSEKSSSVADSERSSSVADSGERSNSEVRRAVL